MIATSAAALEEAAARVVSFGGGISVVRHGADPADLTLPEGGVMSTGRGADVAACARAVRAGVRVGGGAREPVHEPHDPRAAGLAAGEEHRARPGACGAAGREPAVVPGHTADGGWCPPPEARRMVRRPRPTPADGPSAPGTRAAVRRTPREPGSTDSPNGLPAGDTNVATALSML
jgi:hypothetical protein